LVPTQTTLSRRLFRPIRQKTLIFRLRRNPLGTPRLWPRLDEIAKLDKTATKRPVSKIMLDCLLEPENIRSVLKINEN
jgi:hypothetical protein